MVLTSSQSQLHHKRSGILAIDYGRKRIGLAEAEENIRVPFPLKTISTVDIWDFLKAYTAKKNISLLVIGMPSSTYGMSCDVQKDIFEFIKTFKVQYPHTNIYEQDERFSSKVALRDYIIPANKKKKRRDKSLIDKVSASLILSFYFETLAN